MNEYVADEWSWVCHECRRVTTTGWDEESEDTTGLPAGTYPGDDGESIHLCPDCDSDTAHTCY
jgi:hypothetical protein